MKPLFGSANHSRAFNLHFVQINDRIQDNFTPFVRKFSKGKKVHISRIPKKLYGNQSQ